MGDTIEMSAAAVPGEEAAAEMVRPALPEQEGTGQPAEQEATEGGREWTHLGRLGQTVTYLGKLCRMFLYQNDWKVLPMSAVIAGLVSMAIGRGLFSSMEGTLQGCFALGCVCIWNGFFNSIQSICRERTVIKREHRAGLHMTSYVAAHLIYQMVLCLLQSLITLFVCGRTGVRYPEAGILGPSSFRWELFLTLFLITYAADTISLFVSSLVRTTTAAMTVMPFLLIAELVFSGFFSMPKELSQVADIMVSKWGVQSLCAIGHYNDLPAVVIWNKLRAAGGIDVAGIMTVRDIIGFLEEQGMRDDILKKLSEANYSEAYVSTGRNLLVCWGHLALFALVFAFLSVVLLEFIDRDKR